jgi:choice-of-anchor A domain-containing protein
VLYVTSSINIGSGGNKKGWAAPQIHIASGGTLTLYMAGATTSIAGNGLVNDSQQAKNFQYYGLPTNTKIDITGNGAFYGTIYAPQADFSLKGSGNNSLDDFTGSSITKTTTMGGNFKFHYDESLIWLSTLGGYDPISWDEL